MSLANLGQFYGRQDELNLLKKRVLDLKEGYRQNIALLGGRFVGKTTILQKFIADLDDNDIVPVYLDLDNKSFDYFYENFVGSLLYHFCRTHGLPLYEEVNVLLEGVKVQLPQTYKTIRRIQSFRSHEKLKEAYEEIITLPQIFTRESRQFCLLILDEFHQLEDFGIPEVFQELGKVIMTQKRCLYVVISSSPGLAQGILSERLSLLFGNFEVLNIDQLDLKTSQEFIHFQLGDLKISEPLRNFLIDFTGGHPLYLHLLSQQLVRLGCIHKQAEVFRPLLSQAIEDELFNPWGVLGRHFDTIMRSLMSQKTHSLMSRIIVVLSNGKLKLNELAKKLGVKQSSVTQRIGRLLESGLVLKNGHYYYLKDRLLRYWVKYVYQKKCKTFIADHQQVQDDFRQELHEAIDHFNRTSQKDFSSRIMELLYCFENESYQINGRRYKLPLFHEITPVKVRRQPGEYLEMIRAKTDQGEWVIVLKQDSIKEQEVGRILKESRRNRQRPQRCILISMDELDENARLKALQERMWIWSGDEVNTLLNLYDKPYILK